jgi:hypothetical protein
MDVRNGRLLQLIEWIELMKSDVKKKMMVKCACDVYTKVMTDINGKVFRGYQHGMIKITTRKCDTISPPTMNRAVREGL